MKRTPCPNQVAHTESPYGSYASTHDWAEMMLKTHVQKRCPGCGRWAIWEPKSAAARKGARSKRSWTAARAKVREEGICRFCGTTQGLQAAHVVPRSRISAHDGRAEDPRNIVVLCARDHSLQHAGLLELLPLLTLEEQSFAAGLVGLAEAYRRTTNRELAA